MKVVALVTFTFFHNRQQHSVFRNHIYQVESMETDRNEKFFTLKEFPGTEIPCDVFRPVDLKFGREVAKKIEALFPY